MFSVSSTNKTASSDDVSTNSNVDVSTPTSQHDVNHSHTACKPIISTITEGRHSDESLNQSDCTREKAKTRQQHQSEAKVIKLLLTVFLAFVLCFSFNQILSLLVTVGSINVKYGNPLYVISVMIAFANCMINPFIYVIQYSKFRSILFQTICYSHN